MAESLWDKQEFLRGKSYRDSRRYSGDYILTKEIVVLDNKGVAEAIDRLYFVAAGLTEPRVSLEVDVDGRPYVEVAGWANMTPEDHEVRDRLREQKRNRDEEARKNAKQHESCCANCRQK